MRSFIEQDFCYARHQHHNCAKNSRLSVAFYHLDKTFFNSPVSTTFHTGQASFCSLPLFSYNIMLFFYHAALPPYAQMAGRSQRKSGQVFFVCVMFRNILFDDLVFFCYRDLWDIPTHFCLTLISIVVERFWNTSLGDAFSADLSSAF